MSFVNYFLSFPLTVFFTEKKFLILMQSSLSVISFMYHDFGVISKKSVPNPRSARFSLLSSRKLTGLPFIFRSVFHFQLNFVKGERSVSRFIYLCMDVQLF